MSASAEELMAVDEVGDRIAESIVKFFSDPQHRQTVERLKSYGVQMSLGEGSGVKSDVLAGKSFVVSGKFGISRDELKEMIEQHGGRNVSAVSASTDYILAGEAMGPAKAKKAESLGIKIISEQEFYKMLDAGPRGDANGNTAGNAAGVQGELF